VSTAGLPAWSEGFAPDRLGPAPTLDLPGFVTPEWAYGDRRGEGVRVAVVDSGIEGGHPLVGEIAQSVVVELDRDAEDGYRVRPDEDRDLYGHGTACAGIIRELAPGVELHSARVLGEKLTGRARCFAGALEWAIESGMQVVNLSLSTTNEDWYESFMDLADRALRHRVMLVGALSNEPKVSIPSEFASVFSVAAIEGDDRERFLANPSPPAEWGAPGVDVEVAWLGGSTVTVTGNSFAAPVIAALVARIVAVHPGLTCWQVKTILAELAANRA
jgi:subtilisin family serine protease